MIKIPENVKAMMNNAGLLWLRFFVGAGMVYHGYGKFGRIEGFTSHVESLGFPLPALFAWGAALSETLGGGLLVVGLATRPAAAFIAVTMFVAAFVHHGPDPFKEKELAIAYLVTAIAVGLLGAGRFSADAKLCDKK